ncbi:G-type lectin S-receptor-like serine/threonine-protein kinase At4g27290 [Prosopis cineraria]|uniref:G-type lectin S-receptor-like serine/threonine-protein kinase At4g27290 n=1 Tax=Prosopis cineraria TaxID=364024 RepID=UPI00240F6E4F|nr:G-type lectin S-receptor-like serine/threonine-protein kinase At4g27290 [Prosopis cineraria]
MMVFPAKGFVLITTLLLFLFLFRSSCDSLDRITPSQALRDGGILLSDKATFALANRENPLNDTPGVLSINTHGNMVLGLNDINSNLNPLWSSNVSITSPNNTIVKLLKTGNLVLIKNGGRQKLLWQSFDYPGDTILLNMKLGFNWKTGFNWSITSWRSPDDPRFGNVTIEPTGYPQRFIYKNGAPF